MVAQVTLQFVVIKVSSVQYSFHVFGKKGSKINIGVKLNLQLLLKIFINRNKSVKKNVLSKTSRKHIAK